MYMVPLGIGNGNKLDYKVAKRHASAQNKQTQRWYIVDALT